MKWKRKLLMLFGALLLVIDVGASNLILNWPKILVGENGEWKVISVHAKPADYAIFAGLVLVHGLVALGLIRTARNQRNI